MAPGLEGVKVVQTASAAAGPMAGRLLADWGADVICVEHTIRRAQMLERRATPSRGGRRGIVSDVDYAVQNHQRNKRSITLNLSLDTSQEIIHRLLEKSDVLLSNFRPFELKKFKLEYETLNRLNRRLICAHVTGFGRKGPDKDEPGYGPCGDARSGFLHVLQAPGMEPAQMPISFADYLTGLSLAYGIMTALFIREKSGVGQEVDASLFNTMVWAISNDVAGGLVTGQDRQASGRIDRATPLQNTYRTKDGRWVYVMAGQDLHWSKVCQAIGRPELEHDPRFTSLASRGDNHLALFNILDEVFPTKTWDEWKQRLTGAGFPWALVQTIPEVINDPQARANDFFTPFDHPVYGRINLMAAPVKLSQTRETMRMPAPEPGQHTEEVLAEFGYTQDDITRFRKQGVIL